MYVKGRLFQKKGKIKDAISYYSKSIFIEPSPGAYNNRGMLYAETGEYKKAFSDYNKAIELAPAVASSYVNRGEIWTVFGRYEDALLDYNKAIELDDKNDMAYNNRGFYYWQIDKNFKAALRDFNKAIEINPSLPQSYLNRSAVYELLKYDSKDIIYDLTKSISLNHNYVKAYLRRGAIYAKEHHYEKAIFDYSKVVELDNMSILGLMALGLRADLNSRYGLMDNAISDMDMYIEKIVHLSEDSMLKLSIAGNNVPDLKEFTYHGYMTRGKFYLDLKKYQKAKSDFENALYVIPESKEAYLFEDRESKTFIKIISTTMAFTLTRNPAPNFVIDSDRLLLRSWLLTPRRAGNAGC